VEGWAEWEAHPFLPMKTKLFQFICNLTLLIGLILSACSGVPTPQAVQPQEAQSPVPTLTPTTKPVPLVVFGAGSLIIPFDHLKKAFESRYPYIEVQDQYHGSIQVIRQATELHVPIDVVATADASLVPMLMYVEKDPDTGKPYANWYIRFASNRLAVAYTSKSKYADEINSDNWAAVLARPDIKVGIADPRFDASGYRTLMAFALAQDYYKQPKLFSNMFNGRFTSPISIFQDDNLTTITVPEIVETKPNASIVIRGASIQLIALLQTGDLDYAFDYESVIQQHGLEMVHLPDALNLGVDGYDYSKVQVNLDFKRFTSVKPEFRGERIGYAVTIPSNAPHPKEAALFIAFLLGPEGRAIMEADHHPLFNQAVADGYDNLPPDLMPLCSPLKAP
jgi:molybdate/tungstate transport system substrate-binding protein